MSNNWLTYVWKNSPYKGAKRLVHLALADSANAETGECWPRQTVISEKTLVSRQRVNEAIKQMIEDGYLTKSRSGEHGSGNTYWLRMPDQAASETSSEDEENVPIRDVERPQSGHSNVPKADIRTSPKRTFERPHTGHANRAPTEPVGEPSEEATTSEPFGRGGKPKPRPDQNTPAARAPAEGTHAWAVARFEQEMLRHHCGEGFNRGLLDGTLRSLRERDGYTNSEIVILMQYFFVRGEHDIRARRGELDPAQMFRHRLWQLKEQAMPEIRAKRSGRPTATDRAKEIAADRRERMLAIRTANPEES